MSVLQAAAIVWMRYVFDCITWEQNVINGPIFVITRDAQQTVAIDGVCKEKIL